jgi:hypothetical protein
MSKQKPKNVYEFKITLKDIKPKIWRKIQVPEDYNFWDLHVAIQYAMGWEDYHLHQFEIMNPKTGDKVQIGMPDDDNMCGDELVIETKARIAKYFLSPKDIALYEYDFGDGWEHEIVLEKILPAEPGTDYPKCIAGERACPPEDCGGPWGYEELLEIIKDPKHPEYTERIEWLGEDFDAEEFSPEEVEFDDPKERSDDVFA